jgi:hypothetical protein
MLNTLKKFYIYRETVIHNQLNDKNTEAPNATSDAILHYSMDNTLHFYDRTLSPLQSPTDHAQGHLYTGNHHSTTQTQPFSTAHISKAEPIFSTTA